MPAKNVVDQAHHQLIIISSTGVLPQISQEFIAFHFDFRGPNFDGHENESLMGYQMLLMLFQLDANIRSHFFSQ